MAGVENTDSAPPVTRKKPSFPITEGLRGYLRTYKRERVLPVPL